MSKHYKKLIKAAKGKNILLIGDTIIDKNTYGTLLGTSAETPTLVAKKESEKYSLGGAYLVARSIATLGARVSFITLTGEDKTSKIIKDSKDQNLNKILVSDSDRPTTIKSRYWVDEYKMLQFDSIDNSAVSEEVSDKIFSKIEENIIHNDLIIFSDYRHGMLTKNLISNSIELAKKSQKKIYVDSQISQMESNHLNYRGSDFFLLNQNEAKAIIPDQKFEPTLQILNRIREKLNTFGVIVKVGSDGSVGLIGDDFSYAPAINVNAIDTCGAGDAYIAAFSTTDQIYELESRLVLANYWAGKSTEVLGPNPPNIEKI